MNPLNELVESPDIVKPSKKFQMSRTYAYLKIHMSSLVKIFTSLPHIVQSHL